MTTFYTLGARLSGMAAVVCAVLAVLAHPGTARADPGGCYEYCSALYDPNTDLNGLMACMTTCQQAGGKCGGNSCSKDCVDKGSAGNCGAKLCNSGGGCMNCGCFQISDEDTTCTCRDK